MKTCPTHSMVMQTESLLLFLCCFLQETEFCWHSHISMQFATFTVKRHQILNENPKFSGTPLGWWTEALTEQGLQADHTCHKSIKIDGQLAAGVAEDNTLMHLIVELETWRHGKHTNHWHSRLVCRLWHGLSMDCCSCRQTRMKDWELFLQECLFYLYCGSFPESIVLGEERHKVLPQHFVRLHISHCFTA